MGIEPTSEAWEASILPLNYARSGSDRPQNSKAKLRVQLDERATQCGSREALFNLFVIEVVAVKVGDGHLALANAKSACLALSTGR